MRTRIALALLLAIAVFGTYAGTLGHEFVRFDDQDYVYENPTVSAGLTADGWRWAFGFHFSNWYPLTWLSHMLDCELYGLEAGGHHATSVLLHALTAAFVFLALAAWTGRSGPSWFVAALFALHPLRVESVAWIAERKDVLSGVFFAGTLWAYAAYARAPGPARYGLVVLLFALGLMAKPILVTLPALLLLLDFWPNQTKAHSSAAPRRRIVIEKLPLFGLSIASAALTMQSQIELGVTVPFGQRLVNALLSYGRYLVKTLWPTDLACFYPHPAIVDPDVLAAGNPWIWISAAVLVTLTGLAIVQRRRRPWITVGWLWYLGLMVPVLGLFQVGRHGYADRYTYLPSIGLMLALVFTLDASVRAAPARRALTGLGALVLAASAYGSWRQTATWATTETLFEHALAVTDHNYKAHNALGIIQMERGEVDAARAHYEAALAIRPDDARVMTNLARIHQERKELDRARRLYERALTLDPLLVEARCNLAVLFIDLGDTTSAVTQLEAALAEYPDHALAHYLFGVALSRSGDPDAIRYLERAAELDPRFAPPR